ncbi:MAG TPA: S41 family peptidase [Bacillota bacterium]|nr:S41 family peptidase [Bacillota bacterium]
MISKRAAALIAIVVALFTAFFSIVICVTVVEYRSISNGNIAGEQFGELKDFYRKFNGVKDIIEKSYLEEPNSEDLLDGALKGLVEGLEDPYSYYMTAEEYKEMLIDIEGSYAGVGLSVTVNTDDNQITVMNVFKGSPAESVGMMAGDKIIGIGDESVDGAMLDEAVSKMRGEPDTDVSVTVNRDGDIVKFDLTRAIVEYPDMEYRMINDRVGYIWLYRFDQNSAGNMKSAIAELQGLGMEGLVLDLRSNPGGLLTACLEIADIFLPKGLIMYSEDRYGAREEHSSTSDQVDIPLAVLINGFSASASEVFAGAIQDHEVGVVIGKTTFGKGLVQSLMPFTEGDVLRLTTSEYFTPNGRKINGIGVIPNIEVDDLEEAYEFTRDNPGEQLPVELDAALTRGIEELTGLIGE